MITALQIVALIMAGLYSVTGRDRRWLQFLLDLYARSA